MSLLDVINGSKGQPVKQMADQFGIGEDQVQSAIEKFLPALTNGMKREVNDGRLDNLLSSIQNGSHDRYLDDPSALASPRAVEDGNGILGQLLGSKDVSRELAKRASSETGLTSGLLKKMLPIVAGLAMGALKRKGGNDGLFGLVTGAGGRSSGGSSLGPLMSLLDADGDGSVIDDLLGLAGKFMR